MTVDHVEVLVEEPSMEAALGHLLPPLLGDVTFRLYSHRGKHDLLKKLPSRLRGYRAWLPANYRILVIVDRDDEDCFALKQRMEGIARDAGLSTKSSVGCRQCQVINRLAIEELEAWYFGDWAAVHAAYPRVSSTIPEAPKYRNPDDVRGGTWEAFERILKKAGYFSTGLRKIEAARAISQHWNVQANRSGSFCVLRDTLREMASL